MSMLTIVENWLGAAARIQTSVPANFLSRAFELNNLALYTRDQPQHGTAAAELVAKVLKDLKMGLQADRGEATNGHTLFSRVYAVPERKFLLNDRGGVAVFTQLARPDAPEDMESCLILAQAKREADHLLEAHEYEPVFCLAGHHEYEDDGSFTLLVDTLHQQRTALNPTDINTKLALAYADLCFAQLLAGTPMDAEAAFKQADAFSLGKLDSCFAAMSSRPQSPAQDHPRVVPPAYSHGMK